MGRHSVLFAANDFNVSCFDISKEAIERTKDWCLKEGLKCDYKVGDMLKLPYDDESFDSISSLYISDKEPINGLKSPFTIFLFIYQF